MKKGFLGGEGVVSPLAREQENRIERRRKKGIICSFPGSTSFKSNKTKDKDEKKRETETETDRQGRLKEKKKKEKKVEKIISTKRKKRKRKTEMRTERKGENWAGAVTP